jgi:putative oxidoreductase
MCQSPILQEIALTGIRVCLGLILTIFGCNKLLSGTANLIQIGSAMGLFGITWGYLLWGYVAALTELCGGIAFALGFYTRVASIPLIFLLVVALHFHLHNNDPFMKWSFACLCLSVVAAHFIAGGGTYSIDCLMKKCSSAQKHPTNSADQ